MQIHDIISCAQLSGGDRKPVSARVLGELLPPCAYKRVRPFFIDTKCLSFESNNIYMEIYSQLDCPPVSISMFRFHNAIVFGQGSVVVGNRSLLLDSAAEFLNHGLAPDGAIKIAETFETINDTTRQGVKGTSLLVKRPWFRNFGHWLIDLMPLLPLVKDAALDIDNVIFGAVPEGTLKELMRATAQRLYPDARVIYMEDDEQFCFERLLYVQPVHVPPLFKHPLAVEATAIFARTLFTGNNGNFGDRVYVSRQRQNMRVVSNNYELTALLDAKGFRTFYPEEHTMEEQIEVFSSARVMIGVKGAAFSNIVFCNPKTHILVLSPPSFTDPFFWDLACLKGTNYSEIFCSLSKDKNDLYQNIEVPISSVQDFLKRL